jgi:FkbM family methyltransferase
MIIESVERIKSGINNWPFIYAVARKIYHSLVFILSLVAKSLRMLQEIIGLIVARIVFLTKPGNIFFRNYYSDVISTKKLEYRNISLRVRINTYWDYWRLFDYERYPVDVLFDDISKNDTKSLVYYEIGANIGYSVLLIAKKLGENGHVYALEVEPTNFKTLCDNIILNKLVNVTPINLGIANDFGVSKFYYNVYHTNMHKSLPVSGMGAHSITLDHKLHDEKVFCNVLLIPFDNLIKEFKLKDPTHIFIDTHGAELSVIQSMKSSIMHSNLEKIMVDIEQDDIENVKESIIYTELVTAGFALMKSEVAIGSGVFGDSHKSVFYKENNVQSNM